MSAREPTLNSRIRAAKLAACRHATIRAVTPGGRCPICEPRESLPSHVPTREEITDATIRSLAPGSLTIFGSAHHPHDRGVLTPTSTLDALESEITPARLVRGDAVQELAQAVECDDEARARKLREQIDAVNAEISSIEARLAGADAAACVRSLDEFVRFGWHDIDPSGNPFVPNAGTDAILMHLQALGDDEISRLAIAAAPGFGKSALVSIAYPAWMWTRNPTWRPICASHAQALANVLARRYLRLVTGDWYTSSFPWVRIESDAIATIGTSRGGTRFALGLDSAITGIRGDAGVIDDSLNAKDCTPERVRAANDWFEQVFSTRFDTRGKEPPIALIQQRLVNGDLFDLMRSQGAECLVLSAMFESDRRASTSIWEDPRTVEGEVFCPEIHSVEFLAKQLTTLRARGFQSQYQQRPSPKEGNQFKIAMWNWCALAGDGVPPVDLSSARPDGARQCQAFVVPRTRDGDLDVDWVCVSIDATMGSTKKDASALGLGILVGKHQRICVLDDLTDGPKSWSNTIRQVAVAIVRAARIAGKQRRFVVLLEKKAMGASEDAPLPTQLRKALAAGVMRWDDESGENHEVRLVYPDGSPIRFKLELYEPTGKGSKEIRADALEIEVDSGLVHVVDGAPWVRSFLEEFGVFPHGDRDDRVDYVGQCVDHFRAVGNVGRFKRENRRRQGRRNLA